MKKFTQQNAQKNIKCFSSHLKSLIFVVLLLAVYKLNSVWLYGRCTTVNSLENIEKGGIVVFSMLYCTFHVDRNAICMYVCMDVGTIASFSSNL